MSGMQSVLNHLRFARHWLAKAEHEFQRDQSAQGELSLSLVEAEVRKAWNESRRAIRLLSFPGAVPAELPRKMRKATPAVAAALLVAGGLAAAWLLRPVPQAAADLRPLPGASGHDLRQIVRTAPPPAASAAQAGSAVVLPSREATAGSGPRPETPEQPVPRPVAAETEAIAPAEGPAGVPAAVPTEIRAEAPTEIRAEVPVEAPVEPRPSPGQATAQEEVGTPLPLDLVELVRLAEKSLTGRP